MAGILQLSAGLARSGVTFDWATVGDPGNPPDPLNSAEVPEIGTVSYPFKISRHEVTKAQYAEFANAVGKDGGNVEAGTEDWPAITNFIGAVRFLNWLHNGQGTGGTETGAYEISNGKLLGGVIPTVIVKRLPDARFFIPNREEWYKAAFYDPRDENEGGPPGNDHYWLFPTQSDAIPTPEPPPGGFNSANYESNEVVSVGSYPETTSYYGLFNLAANIQEFSENVLLFGGVEEFPGIVGGGHQPVLGRLQAHAMSSRAVRDLLDEGKGTGFSEFYLGGFRVATTQDIDNPVDEIAPRIAVLAPTAGTTNNRNISVAGTVSDESGIAFLRFIMNDGEPEPVSIFEDSFSVANVQLGVGDNRLRIEATDLAGNNAAVEVVVTWEPDRILSLVGTPELREGSILALPIMLDSNGDVAGLTFSVTFDPADFADAEISIVPQEGLLSETQSSAGRVVAALAIAGGNLDPRDQILGVLSMRMRSVPEARTSPIDIEITDISNVGGDPLVVGNYVKGTAATILPRTFPGDINANSRLDPGDASLMQRMLAGIDESRPWDQSLNDLNGNSVLDSGDVVRVLRAAVGIDAQPGNAQRVARDGQGDAIAPRVVLLSDKSPTVGEEMTVRVVLDEIEQDASGVTFRVNYPVTSLRLESSESHKPGPIISGGSFLLWNVEPDQNDFDDQTGVVSFAASSAVPWSNSANGGELASLKFQVLPEFIAEDLAKVSLAEVDIAVDDGYTILHSTDTSLTINAARLTFAQWITENFPANQLEDQETVGWSKDPDGDGQGNGLEFFQGSSPTLPQPSSLQTMIAGTGADAHFRAKIRKALFRSGVTFSFQQSIDLVQWSDIDDDIGVIRTEPDGEKFECISLELIEPIQTLGGSYIRVSVRESP